jgi:hypothetical protein
MNYSDVLKVNWITPRRTATRSCSEVQKFYNFDIIGSHEFNSYNQRKDYTLIFNIRNPYQRLVSIFYLWKIHNPHKDSIKFNFWVKIVLDDLHKNINYYQIFLDEIINQLPKIPDYYLKTEFLEKDLKKLWFIDNNSIELNKVIEDNIIKNKYSSSDTPWQSFYNQELADFVYSRTEKQFELFNYNKNYWKDGTP